MKSRKVTVNHHCYLLDPSFLTINISHVFSIHSSLFKADRPIACLELCLNCDTWSRHQWSRSSNAQVNTIKGVKHKYTLYQMIPFFFFTHNYRYFSHSKFQTDTYFEEVKRGIKHSSDSLLQELFEHTILVNTSFIQTLVINKGVRQ